MELTSISFKRWKSAAQMTSSSNLGIGNVFRSMIRAPLSLVSIDI